MFEPCDVEALLGHFGGIVPIKMAKNELCKKKGIFFN